MRMALLEDSRSSSTTCTHIQERQKPNQLLKGGMQHLTKKRKLDHPLFPPPHFWDNLSQPFLTKLALQELNRRNAIKSRSQRPPESQYRRPYTRCAVAASRESSPLPAHEFYQQTSPSDRAQIRRFARNGGPDLKDLRGVGILQLSSIFYISIMLT